MDIIYRIINVLGILFTLAMTVWMVLSSRREGRITAFTSFVSVATSLFLLPVYTLLIGPWLNLLRGLPILGLGLLIGCIGGVTARLAFRDGQVMGKNSWLFLLIWGGSLALSQLLNLFDSGLLAALGLAPVFLTTGTQVGRDGTILVRRLMMAEPPPALPSTTYTSSQPPPVPVQSQGLPVHFVEAERRLAQLRASYQAGGMDLATYNASLQGLMINDGAGGFWSPGENGAWYWYNGREWVQRDPSGSPSIPAQSQRLPTHFAEAERRLAELRASYQAGGIGLAAYNAALQGLMIDDGAGGFWFPGSENGAWYWYNGQEWVWRDPISG